jgi:hypothetical protein
MNLSLFLGLIDAGRMVGIDLASFESPDGRSIRRALDWLTPFYLGQAVWQHQQIVPFPAENSYAILRYAACLMNTPSYAERAESIPTLSPQAKQTSRARLMYP